MGASGINIQTVMLRACALLLVDSSTVSCQTHARSWLIVNSSFAIFVKLYFGKQLSYFKSAHNTFSLNSKCILVL